MSNTNVTISFTVAPLPDNDIWFANSAAWSNYWSGQSATASIPVATTITYGVVLQASTTAFVDPGVTATTFWDTTVDNGDGSGTTILVPTLTSFAELKASHAALTTNYQLLKTAMVTAGLITA